MRVRVMIVEDEPPILRDIRTVLQSIPFAKIVAEACNGAEAMDMMADSKPDLILTDIRMPVIDGLTLIERAKRVLPTVQTAVVTGYDEFEYAREACHLQVQQYLLKPVDEEGVRRLLSRTREIALAAKRSALGAFLDSAGQERPVDVQCDSCQSFLVTVGFSDSRYRSAGGSDQDSACMMRHMSSRIEAYLSSALGPDDVAFSLPSPRCTCLRVVIGGEGRAVCGTVVSQLSAAVRREQPRFHTIVRCPNTRTLEELREHVRRGEDALPRFVTAYQCTIVDMAAGGPGRCVAAPQEAYLSNLCANGQVELFLRTIEKTLRSACEEGCSQYVLEEFIRRLIVLATTALVFVGQPDVPALDGEAISLFRRTESADEAVDTMAGFFRKLFQTRVDSIPARDLVRNVESYLRSRYAEPIDSQLLGRLFGLVPHYLSAVYRKHKDRSPTEHLSEIRIERAKEILREAPGLPIRDVACTVGFGDQSYFTKVFKRHVGVTPGAYRAGTRATKDTG